MKGSFELGHETTIWVSRIVITITVIFVVFVFASLGIEEKVEINELRSDLLMKRLYYSPDCFAFEDERVYPGVIDLKKFNKERVDRCLVRDFPIKVELVNKNIVIKDDNYDDYVNLCELGQGCFFSNRQYVLVNGNEEDILNIDMVIR